MARQASDGGFTHAPEFNALIDGVKLRGVVTGCVVTANPGADPNEWRVNVASGTIRFDGAGEVSVSAQDVVPADPGATRRYDLVVLDSAGTATVVQGTDKKAPDLPTDKILLALVHIDPGESQIQTGEIFDARVFVPPQARGALVYLNANDTITHPGGPGTLVSYNISWDAEKYDTDGLWDNGTPTRLTVPTGVKRVRLHMGVAAGNVVPASGDQVLIDLLKNGSPNFHGRPAVSAAFGFTHEMNATSPVLEVTGGDYFEFRVRFVRADENNLTLTGNADGSTTWFMMEIIA